jgi:hypothetical protein
LSNNTGLLLLCEVAAKPFYEQMNANYCADEHCKANQKLSVIFFSDYNPHLKPSIAAARKELDTLSLPSGRMPELR